MSDVRTGLEVVNQILDVRCSRSVAEIEAAAALCLALGMSFELRLLDFEPFFHGYGMHCSEAERTIAI